MGIQSSYHLPIVGSARRSPLRPWCIPALLSLVLAACGQKGSLVLPTEAAARDRATLPQTLLPGSGAAAPAPGPNTVPRPTPPASAAR